MDLWRLDLLGVQGLELSASTQAANLGSGELQEYSFNHFREPTVDTIRPCMTLEYYKTIISKL